jgi:hypothetical protein
MLPLLDVPEGKALTPGGGEGAVATKASTLSHIVTDKMNG